MDVNKRKPWTRDELILAINLYCKTPFGRIHVRNPDIIELAERLGRTPGSVSYKLANFASIDESLPRKGASNVSRLDKEVWKEFFENWEAMAYESERRASELLGRPTADWDDLDALPEGKSRETLVRARVNQDFFRKIVLATYNEACCITGTAVPELLVASHIVPWSVDTRNRVNPRNGLCLNALHDRAFDQGLITIDDSFRVVVAQRIANMPIKKTRLILDYEGVRLAMPKQFTPDERFLQYHREHVFLG
jgi:putative restriction endonuclease